ncbi:hypothetical protein OROGR_021039 [Orobanche gracilis]
MVISSCKMMNGMLDQELEQELMKFTAEYEESELETDLTVDIMESRESKDDGTAEAECMDTTESSSSFDGSDCGVGDPDEAEVLSAWCGDTPLPMDFDGFGEIFRMRRKKKRTNHWRTFIKPLMWRCKWAELQIMKVEAESEKYDRELEKCHQQKPVLLEESAVEDLGVKSLPFPENRVRGGVFMRKKRRRDEATKNVAAYMSCHNLFSYYENRECFTSGGSIDIDLSHATQKDEINDGLSCVDNDDDVFLEKIFRMIDILRSRVGELKCRADKITYENAERFSCPDNNGFYSTDNVGNGISVGAYVVSQLMAEYRLSEFLATRSAVGACCDDARTNPVFFAGPDGNEDYGALIDNPRMKEEMNSLKQFRIQPIIQRSVSAEPNRHTDDTCSILKTFNPKGKNKRGRDCQRVRFAI